MQPETMTTRNIRPRCGQPAGIGRRHGPASVLVRGAVLLALIALVPAALMGTLPGWLENATSDPLTLIAACLLYAVLLAVPFVPSVEIGLLIMVVFGKQGAVGAWLATLVGLNLAYGIGRLIVRRRGRDLQLPTRFQAWVARLGRYLPAGWVPALALAALLNLPGNTALGGGGGIAMLYSASRTLNWPAFAITTSLATAALPLTFLFGAVGVEQIRL